MTKEELQGLKFLRAISAVFTCIFLSSCVGAWLNNNSIILSAGVTLIFSSMTLLLSALIADHNKKEID
jgi:hypothetical protein